jgi:hypothetical protein
MGFDITLKNILITQLIEEVKDKMYKKQFSLTFIFSMMIILVGISSETYGDDGNNNFNMAFTDTPTDMVDTNTRDIMAGSDVDQDGKFEIIVTDYDNGGQVHVFEVIGDNTIEWVWSSAGTNSSDGVPAREVKTGDLDNDGLGEILLSISANGVSSDSSGIYVYEWDGVNDNGYIPMGIITVDLSMTEGYTEDFIVDDIDGDGTTEAVFLNDGSDEVDNCYIISISGTFETTWSQITEATFTRSGGDFNGSPYDVAIGDLDGDTFNEVIISLREDAGALFIAESSSPNTYTSSAYVHIDTTGEDGFSLEAMATADFNGDGADELFVATYASKQLAVVTGGTDVSAMTFEDNVRILRTGGIAELGMAIGDQDHGAGSDGPDIYLSNYGSDDEGGYIQNFEFTGTDIFDPSAYTEHVIFQDTEISQPAGLFQIDVPPVDLDGDGNLELLLSYTGTDLPEDVYVRVFEFNTNVPTLTLTSPNGGEDWGFGTVQNITWTSENYIGGMRIEYSTDSGSNWNEIISYTANDGNYDWSIPNDPSSNCLVRISKMEDGPPSDESDGPFTISAPPMAAITFIIDDSQFQELSDCWILGSWDNNGFYDSGWSSGEQQMYDDGTNGDGVAGDHLWSLKLDLVVDAGAETWEWGALDGPGGSWLIEGANEQFALPDNSPQTLTYVREGFSTPCTGVSWTLDDLVTNSGGIVTGTYPNYVTQKTIVICVSDELTVTAGSTLKFEYGEVRVFGALHVLGEEGNLVTFTSNKAMPAADDWGSLDFKSGSSGSVEYAHIEYSHVGVWCESGTPDYVTNCVFNDIKRQALLIENIEVGVFEYNTISTTEQHGAHINSVNSLEFNHNHISNSAGHGIRLADIITGNLEFNTIANTPDGAHGIRIENMASGRVANNTISYVGASGMRIITSSIECNDNTIFNVAHNGFTVIDVSSAQFDSNSIYGATQDGFSLTNSSPNIQFNLIYNNSDEAIDCSGSFPNIINNTIDNNGLVPIPEGTPSAGIECGETSNPVIKNNIITNNADHGINSFGGSAPVISYNDIWGHSISNYQGCSPVTGDISEDPLYQDPPSANYSLQSNSPCIDAGDPTSPLDPDGTRADMGAFYFDPGEHFVFNPTEDYYPIIIENVTLDDQPILDGDEVGVFFRNDNNDLVCGGAIIWPNTGMEAWGDDTQTPEKDGFVAGEELVFKLWDASERAEWGPPINVTYTTGNGTWGDGSYAIISVIEFRISCSLTIELVDGWNWVSSNVPPFEPAVVDLWTGKDCLDILKSYSGFYVPDVYDGIGDWDYLQMYTAYLTCPETLTIEGTCIDPSEPIVLQENWNWASYLPKDPIPIETALASIIEYLNIVKSYDGFFVPGLWDGIGDMIPGKGYKMHVSQECTLTYPSGDALPKPLVSKRSAITDEICSHFADFKTTEDYQAILIQSINGNDIDLEAGDEIGIYTTSGLCVGGTVVTDKYPLGIMAWQDDPRTEEVDGFTPGEKVAIKYWDASEEEEYELLKTIEEGSQRLGESILAKVSLEIDLSSTSAVPTVYSLAKNYPNPFNPETTIRYGIPEASHVKLTLYTITGQLVKQLENGYKEAGYHQVMWSGTNDHGESVSSGVYIYRIEAGTFSDVKKMVFLK